MINRHERIALGLVVLFLACVDSAWAQELTVVGVEPPPRSRQASVATAITVHFDKPVTRASITSSDALWAFGHWSGTASGSFSFSDGDRAVTLTPSRPFSAGETVMVILSNEIGATDGSFLRSAGYSYQFWTLAQPALMEFVEIDRLTTRSIASQPTQAYGGIGSDLNGDGYLDLAIIHEISADVRVFLNKADDSGLFFPFAQPPYSVGVRASPNEPSDFNRDGIVDLCVANITDGTVSVLLGVGDGSFAPQQIITVGSQPRGIAVLDANGDGYPDIVNTNAGEGALNLSLLLNDQTGFFGNAMFFEGGAANARALTAADMNQDGILDLVMGARSAQEIVVHTGNGDGTFTEVPEHQNSGGQVWMLVCGDVNGDGTEDVAVVNATFSTGNGAILLGDGTGRLGPPTIYAADPFALATDLGDLDGDTDLDWVTSSYNGNWRINTNNGDGTFTFHQEIEAAGASSCALLMDIDNDLDLDLALIDEVADEVIVLQNSGFGPSLVPTLSVVGFLVMGLFLLAGGTLILRRRARLAINSGR